MVLQELLELLKMPVLRAKGEAEALCAQLNNSGYVDACITADSDAFLFGAKCVIKCIHPNSKVSDMILSELWSYICDQMHLNLIQSIDSVDGLYYFSVL